MMLERVKYMLALKRSEADLAGLVEAEAEAEAEADVDCAWLPEF